MYGPLHQDKKQLPPQRWQTIELLAERFQRDFDSQRGWATEAKKCVEFVEGKQWSADDLKVMDGMGRAALTFNKIAPLVRLVQGYFRNNRTDEKFLSGSDDLSSDATAEAITKLCKQISENSQQPYVDAEVFGDGITTARGYYDTRLSFEENMLGEAAITALDPFSVYPDSDAYTYDPNPGPNNAGWNRVTTTSWASVHDITETYGEDAGTLIRPLVEGGGYTGLPASVIDYGEEITPWRRFGGEEDQGYYAGFGHMGDFLHNIFDHTRKTVRVIDMQHYIRTKMRIAMDLETGLFKPFPDDWEPGRIQKFFDWAAYKAEEKGRANPMRYDERVMKRLRWTVAVGDILVHDDWSPYKTMTVIPYFPYFRRGKTRGMVDDLISPQEQINVNRSASVDMVKRTANGGWQYKEDDLDEEQEANYEQFGASPGFMGKYKGNKPEQIFPSPPNQKNERLENQAADDLNDISGLNRDSMGMDDKVKSGKAMIARQRQGVLGLQTYMDNMSRTRELVGRKKLELIQNHYREERLVRIQGQGGSLEELRVNQRVNDRIINDVALGKYTLSFDETPLSASFVEAQFDELMEMIEKGVLPIEAVMDLAVDYSSLGNKEVIKQRVQGYMAAKGMPVGDAATPPGMPPVDQMLG